MGQPRASRRRVITISSDEDEDDTANLAQVSDDEKDDQHTESAKPQKQATGKLKSVRKGKKVQEATASSSAKIEAPRKSPRNTKVTQPVQTKGKPAAIDTTKPKAKPIYSFFNTATQRQRSTQPSASPEKPSTPQEVLETIDSDDDKSASLKLSKGSSTALTLRKRKAQQNLNVEDEASLLPPPTQKFRKTSDGRRSPSMSIRNEDKRPWIEQFAPVDLSELAVHKRKVTDVRQWLETAVGAKRNMLLVVKGPAGAAKTATVRLLADDLKVGVMDWRNPAGSDYLTEGVGSAAAQFEEFLARAGGGSGLQIVVEGSGDHIHHPYTSDEQREVDGHKRLILVEEFPNTFSRNSPVLQSFRSAILQYLATPTAKFATPLVMVISETLLSTNTAAADSFTAHRLLGPEILNSPYTHTIEFNPVATTILTKALDTIMVKEARKSGRRNIPGPAVIKHLAETGDIRSAVSSLEFLCLRGGEGDIWSAKVAFTKTKKSKTTPDLTATEQEALKLISNRESTLGIFHAVGKVAYNKRTESALGEEIVQPPPWLPQHRRSKVSEINIDRLIDELGTDTPTFLAALHENYLLSCSSTSIEESLDSVSGCINSISDADLLSLERFSFGTRAFSGSATDTLRQDEMSFQAAVRGLLFNLPYPVHRSAAANGRQADAHRMYYPTSLKLWKERESIEGVIDLLTARMQSGGLTGLSNSTAGLAVSKVDGVDGWRSHAATKQSDDVDIDSAPINASAKMEMLIDRLPYMARIMEQRNSGSQSTFLSEQIRKVTGVGKAELSGMDDDEANAAESQHNGLTAEQWTTDLPDVDDSQTSKRKKKGRGKIETEGEGLNIPVENSVAKLVLEDDDIIDD